MPTEWPIKTIDDHLEKDRQKQIEFLKEWNSKIKPLHEFRQHENAEEVTGVFMFDNDGVQTWFFAPKRKNGYHPHELFLVPTEVFETFNRFHADALSQGYSGQE